MHHFNEVLIEILSLLAVSVAVTAAAKKLDMPYAIALVMVGLILGLVPIAGLEEAEVFITESEVFQAIVISLFLPILLGDAALKLPFARLKEERIQVLALAAGCTLLSFAAVAAGAYYALDLPLVVAFTFAALMSATDPISVISIFKSLGVPGRLVTMIEGESLFNDGVAVVLFQISSVYLLGYMEMGWAGFGAGALLFLKIVLGGLAVGAVFGYAFSQLVRPFDDYPLEIAFSLLLFFGAFFTAEHFHVSGVIAVVTGGLIFGSYGAKIGMSDTTLTNIHSFWDVIALLANSLIFLMIGLEILRIDLADKWFSALLAFVIVVLGRTAALYLSTAPVKGFPRGYKPILNWGGLRGSLSVALALSLPQSFEGRDDVLVLTFGVVLFSLLLQGTTIKPLIVRLGLANNGDRGR